MSDSVSWLSLVLTARGSWKVIECEEAEPASAGSAVMRLDVDRGYRVTLAVASVTIASVTSVKQIERAAQRAEGLRISFQRCPRGRTPQTRSPAQN